MELKKERELQALRRTYTFGDVNPALVPVRIGPVESWTTISRQQYELGLVIVRMEAAGVLQSRQYTQTQLSATDERSLRRVLNQEMRPVAQVAQVLRNKVPGIGNLKMGPSRQSVESMLNYGKSFVDLAKVYNSVLVEHGLPADCITRIEAAIQPLKASLDGRGGARTVLVAATKDVALCAKQGRDLVRLMDAAITVALRNDPVKLREWKNAIRVTRVGVQSPVATQAPALVSTPDIGATSPQLESRAA